MASVILSSTKKMGVNLMGQVFFNIRAVDPTVDLFYNDSNSENGSTKTTNLLALLDGLKL